MKAVRLYMTNAASSVATRVLQITVLVWVNQYLLRRIEPAEYSIFPVVLSLMIFADVVKYLITGGIGRFLVEADSRGDQAGVTRIVSSMFPVVLLAALFFATAGGLAAWRIDDLLQIQPAYLHQARVMLLLLTFSLCLSVITAPFVDGLYVRQRFVIGNVIDLGTEALRIAILLALLFGVSTRVTWLVVASACAAAVNIGIRVVLTRQWIPAVTFRRNSISGDTVKTLLRFGGWTSLQGITALISGAAPTLLLNRFGTALDVTAFYLGRLPDIHIRSMAGAASSPAQPAMTSIFAKQGAVPLRDLYYRGGRYFLWVTLPLVAPLLIFGRQIVSLYAGAQYAPAATVIFWLLAFYPFIWASAMFFQVAHAIGRIGAFYACDAIVQAVTLLALWYAVSSRGLGAAGAAMGIGLAGGILHVVLIWPMGLRLVEGRWSIFARQTLLPGLLPFASACVACYVFSLGVEVNSWPMIASACVLSLAVYCVVLLVWCLDLVDRDVAARIAHRFLTLPARSVRVS